MSVVIEHTAAGGTLVDGTSRGDGSAAILKGLGWRWGRSIGQWYVPRSRDQKPNRALIERTADALRADGFTVEVQVDDTARPTSEVEADKIDRAAARADALTRKAARLDAQSQAAHDRATTMASAIPFGQPILIGHHSEQRDRRYRQRITDTYDKSFRLASEAQGAQHAADTAAATTGARYSVETVGNRIETLGADLRRAERAGRTTAAAELAEKLAYWQQVRAEQIAHGTAGDFGPHTIAGGDLVKVLRSWYVVERVSAKSVTVRGDFGPSRVPYHKITGHRQPTPLDHAAAHLRGKGWTILARNWTQDAHSLDLVARDPGGVIVAVLVSHSEDGDPLAQITTGAAQALKTATDAWVAAHGKPVPLLRLDAVGIRSHPGRNHLIEHVHAIA